MKVWYPYVITRKSTGLVLFRINKVTLCCAIMLLTHKHAFGMFLQQILQRFCKRVPFPFSATNEDIYMVNYSCMNFARIENDNCFLFQTIAETKADCRRRLEETPEPETDGANVIQIRIKWPSGSMVARRFCTSDKFKVGFQSHGISFS